MQTFLADSVTDEAKLFEAYDDIDAMETCVEKGWDYIGQLVHDDPFNMSEDELLEVLYTVNYESGVLH